MTHDPYVKASLKTAGDLWVEQNTPKQIPIHRASFRILHEIPAHLTLSIWINGGKAGDLTIRQEEKVSFFSMLERAGIFLTELSK